LRIGSVLGDENMKNNINETNEIQEKDENMKVEITEAKDYNGVKALPKIKLGHKEYFVDERLGELRNIKDPNDRETIELYYYHKAQLGTKDKS
jgi:hypothetical protein